MKIGAYPFAVSGNIDHNLFIIRRAMNQAAREGVRLLAFPECAITGYPPHDLPSSSGVDWTALAAAEAELQRLAKAHKMCIIAGAITKQGTCIHNSAVIFTPEKRFKYHKRALWGWDRENFLPGEESGVFEFDGVKIGVRICYEIRFPEYFRELYRQNTDLNIVLFYDVANAPDPGRYDLIRAHIRTRAAENLCPLLSVNAIAPHQTAPTMLCDRSGYIPAETKPGMEELLISNFEPSVLDFSETGRKSISDSLIK